MANPARAYLATQVETTTQGELLIMLYEAAIKFLKRAKIEIDNKDFAKKGIYISKAMAIVHELAECLNKDKGGEITPKLGQLYMFCNNQLIKANIRLDNKMIDEVIQILDGLRSAYAQIVPIHDGKKAPTQTVKQTAPIPPRPVAPPITPPAPTMQETTPEPSAPPKTATPKGAESAQPSQPATPAPQPPLKIRTGANAAKLRAANAYTNANR
ncbi:flagellar export chaperone FliS [Pseudodesulfovibrio sediminis]|uniref:Flagellar protein FliS n=1 Tax=Pseudodesulfovibrio sediminis TaxID=2810563 RepID=A0ABN6EVJ9_9BACT|nr:flagellar export chaperone FliS [Pseudodesulfovibrio sediminis]BCS90301.1 hypothetical protein PSDVSF_35430 [Pseudodesulfovibrio sediminis]